MSNVARVAAQAANTLSKPLDVEDLFSTYLYTGNGSTQTITNGIDLAGEGGLVAIKRRDADGNWGWYDTERGPDSHIKSNGNNAEQTTPDVEVKDFNSNGFDLGTNWNAPVNTNNAKTCSWTFRKAPKFFDVVTYTGDGSSNRSVSHNLGSTPGCIIVKRTNGLKDWAVYHRGKGSTHYGTLNTSESFYDAVSWWQDTNPTSTDFTVGNSAFVNANGDTYVAYLFAHNDGDAEFGPNGNADIIKCGTYQSDGNGSEISVDLGFEAQFVMAKAVSTTGNWHVQDSMRGMAVGSSNNAYLQWNTSDSESADGTAGGIVPTSNGFRVGLMGDINIFNAVQTYIYIAIRRPTAVPESATEVFAISDRKNEIPSFPSGFPVDFLIGPRTINGSDNNEVKTRLISGGYLRTNTTGAENASSQVANFAHNDGFFNSSGANANQYSWMWKRAPNYFDVVAYTGNGSKQTIAHNLGVAPEMMWIKVRSTTQHWAVYHPDLPGSGKFISLNNNWDGNSTNSNFWDGETPTSTTFSVGATGVNNNYVNGSPNTYIAYLFATLAGISKVGSVTHSGTTNVDCGFSAGSRFVLLKRTDATGDWYVWDSERGIVSGNDPYLLLNSTAAQVAVQDYINPLPSGFTITSNFDYGDYIFYAIA